MLTHTLARLMAVVPSPLKYRLARLKPLYNCLLGFGSRVVTVRLPGGTVRWQIDALTSQQHLLGTYEPYLQAALARWVRPGDVVYDIGAHAGFHTLCAALLVGPSGQVIAFEPYPQNFRSLQRQLSLNPGLPARALAIAASDQTASLRMHRPGSSSQSHIAETGKVQVAAQSLDDLVQAGVIAPPNLIKLDVEGHEAAVLCGALTTITAHRPVLLCDYNDADTEALVRQALGGLAYDVSPGPPVTAVPQVRR